MYRLRLLLLASGSSSTCSGGDDGDYGDDDYAAAPVVHHSCMSANFITTYKAEENLLEIKAMKSHTSCPFLAICNTWC